jgi:hypothetical protein
MDKFTDFCPEKWAKDHATARKRASDPLRGEKTGAEAAAKSAESAEKRVSSREVTEDPILTEQPPMENPELVDLDEPILPSLSRKHNLRPAAAG